MKHVWHKITKITCIDFALTMSILMIFVAIYCAFVDCETGYWKDFVICSLFFLLTAHTQHIRQLRDKINELQNPFTKQKRGQYDQVALNRLRERNG